MIITRIKAIPLGTTIPKPEAKHSSKVKGIGIRRGKEALIYTIPNHRNPSKLREKGVTFSEFEAAYHQLVGCGELTKLWFRQNLGTCNSEGSCNFTTIGGILELIGEAFYADRGIYRRKPAITVFT